MMKYSSCKLCGGNITQENKKYELVKCQSCALAFYENDLTDIDLAAYYKDVYATDYTNYGKAAVNMSKGGEQTIGHIKSQVMSRILGQDHGSIVEFGAGVGIIANYLKGKDVSYQGFELVETVVAEDQRRGLNIKQGDFTVLGNYKNTFNTVLAFEVIEHIDNLKLCLSLVHDTLKDGGRFGFTVPNYDKRLNYPNDSEGIYQVSPPVHVNFFTVESINKMAALFNFKVEYLAERSYPQKQKTLKEFARLMFRKITGNFHGSNIMCILKKA